MPTMLEVWEPLIGVREIPGKKHNEVILAMWKDAGHDEIIDDETAWCSGSQCAVAKRAGYPIPPVNINTMARSWLTWGVTVDPKDMQPNDVIVWPRGPKPYGHVNTVKEVRRKGKKVEVRCVGGNQGKIGAVSVTDWMDISGALPNGVRRGVRPTVKDLRAAGSSTIKANDNLEKAGVATMFVTPIIKGVEALFGTIDVPEFASLPEGLTWWGSLLGAANAVVDYALAHPYLAATLLCGLAAFVISRINKAGRVAEHAAGIPIAAEVAKLEAA